MVIAKSKKQNSKNSQPTFWNLFLFTNQNHSNLRLHLLWTRSFHLILSGTSSPIGGSFDEQNSTTETDFDGNCHFAVSGRICSKYA